MTEPVFKAPLPPSDNGFTPPSSPEKGTEQASDKKKISVDDVKQKISLYLWYVLGGTFLIGLILGMAMAGDDSAPVVHECSLKYVKNPDIQGRFPLCGRTASSEPCILYIMNSTRYDHQAEDFFKDAERLTERAKYNISIENPIYSKLNVPPGYFAEIKIPSLR